MPCVMSGCKERGPLKQRGCILPCWELGAGSTSQPRQCLSLVSLAAQAVQMEGLGHWRLVSEHKGEGMG